MKKIQLGKVSKYIRGITFKPIDVVEPSSPDVIVCMRTKNVQQDLDQSDLIAVSPKFVKRDEQYLHEGDLLVSSANSWNLVGKTCYVPNLSYKATAGGFISIVRPNRKQVEPRYLYHWLSSDRTQHYARLCGRQTTNISNLDRHRFLELKLPIPPLEEQRRIAAILDKADAVRRKRKEAIALTEDLLRSAFLEMFGDPVANPNVKMLPKGWIKTNVDSIKADAKWSCVGGPFGSNLTTKDYVAIPGVPVIRGNNLSKESLYISESGFTYVSQEKADSLLQNIAYPGDILFTQRGTLGQVGMLPEDSRFPRYVVSQSQMKLTPDLNIVSPTWLVTYFQSPVALRTLRTQVLATGVPHINLSILKNFPVNLPPIEQQKKYSKFCKQHLLILEKQKNSCSEAEDLFDSLLQRAFRGDL